MFYLVAKCLASYFYILELKNCINSKQAIKKGSNSTIEHCAQYLGLVLLKQKGFHGSTPAVELNWPLKIGTMLN